MSRTKHPRIAPVHIFIRRFLRNLVIGSAVMLFSLGLGMLGYSHFEKMNWIDAYINASMILSGMGPVDVLHTEGGKLFAGTYALFSGSIFLVVIAVIIAPVFHRFMQKFQINDTQ
jgi:hypothetical protein